MAALATVRCFRLRLPPRVEVGEVADSGKLIRTRRRELGCTQEYLASMLGWSPRLIGEIEHGRGTVGIERVFILLNGLGIDVTLTVRGNVQNRRQLLARGHTHLAIWVAHVGARFADSIGYLAISAVCLYIKRYFTRGMVWLNRGCVVQIGEVWHGMGSQKGPVG